MPENTWFYGDPGTNAYNISEHIRQSLWLAGYREAWFDCTKTDPPYAGTLRWLNQAISIEWEPRQWLIAKLVHNDNYIVKGLSTILGFKPQIEYENAEGRTVFEWRRTGLSARTGELAHKAEVDQLERIR
jgi:hypothetical protein